MAGSLDGKRITIVIPAFDMGGAERQALLLGRYLKEQVGALVQLWAFQRPGGIVAQLCDVYGIPARIVPFDLPSRRFDKIRHIWHYARELRRAGTDIALAFSHEANLACGLAWRFSGARACIWNQRDEGRYLSGRGVERLAVSLTPMFIANSRHGADFLLNLYQINPERVHVVYNGIELMEPQMGRAEWRERLGIRDGCLLVCMVANLSHTKDHLTLLRAWREVIDRLQALGRDAVLLLAGGFANMHDAAKALAYDLELGRSVRFLGPVEDVSGLLRAVDLGVFSTKLEGLPNGVLETMMAGLALAATDIPGIREAISPDNVPYLSPLGDNHAMASNVLKLLDNHQERGRIGNANARWVEENFSPQQMCQQMVMLIGRSLEKSKSI